MSDTYPFTLKPLPYAYNALEPYIGTETMIIHHTKLLQNYINRLNGILKDYPAYQNWTLEELLINNNKLPKAIRIDVHRNAGGVFNHNFFFNEMKPHSPTVRRANNNPNHIFCDFLNEVFTSFQNFKEIFSHFAMSVFGSGYAWLVMTEDHLLKFMTTANQDTPLPSKLQPILMIDVWEHAYFLDYKSDRARYIEEWFNVINWDKIEEIYMRLI